jgi:hypothetical protein
MCMKERNESAQRDTHTERKKFCRLVALSSRRKREREREHLPFILFLAVP